MHGQDAEPHSLDQGPFSIRQDQGWRAIGFTSPLSGPLRRYGCGLIGYAWEEGGPAHAVREGRRSLEAEVQRMAALDFVDVLYIRCDWRDVQDRPGALTLAPVWSIAREAVRRHGKRLAFRIQMSSPEIQPSAFSLPDFLRRDVPMIDIGRPRSSSRAPEAFHYYEPAYHHPRFISAFTELQHLLAERFDGDELVEFVDLMMYGFWGEGHTSDCPHPFPDGATAERTCLELTRIQLEAWQRTPLVVNLQPDISGVGNEAVRSLAVANGCWARTDSILQDEPEQIELLANRRPETAAVIEDGYRRLYDPDPGYLPIDEHGLCDMEYRMGCALDAGASYWALWTETDTLLKFAEAYPDALARFRSRIGYRVRPSWTWQRRRDGAVEVVLGLVNDGVAGVPGRLEIEASSDTGQLLEHGLLDPGLPAPGRARLAALRLASGCAGKPLFLRAFLRGRGPRRPVPWACPQALADGRLRVNLLRDDSADFRYGI